MLLDPRLHKRFEYETGTNTTHRHWYELKTSGNVDALCMYVVYGDGMTTEINRTGDF